MSFVFLSWVLAPVPGCSLVYPYQTSSRADGKADAAQTDAAIPSDHGKSIDATRQGETDGQTDGRGEGFARDAVRSDAVSGESIPASACIAPATLTSWRQDMIICSLPMHSYTDQCDAEQYCNRQDGWHMCKASEYLARGGRTEKPPIGVTHWLAGCVRAGGTVVAPSDSKCAGGCTDQDTGAAPVEWACGGQGTWITERQEAYVGVYAALTCAIVGVEDPANEGFWRARPETASANGVVCCR